MNIEAARLVLFTIVSPIVAAFLAKNGAWWGIAIFQCAAGILAEVS